jgi:alpha-tubulin suppressor-like RCC1 family protein
MLPDETMEKRMTRAHVRVAVARSILVLASIAACSDQAADPNAPAPDPDPFHISVIPPALQLVVGGAPGQLTALVNSRTGPIQAPTVTWVSQNPSVATVSPTGATVTVVPVAAGSTGIRATSGGVSFLATVVVSAPALLPTVTVSATDAAASEAGPDAGAFTVSRSGATTAALVVNFALSGTATNGVDYASLNSAITIPAGQASATVVVNPLTDAVTEANETVILTLTPGSYVIASANAATVTIADSPAGAVWASLSTGYVTFACGVSQSAAYCWGTAWHGDGNAPSTRTSPVAVSGNQNWSQISAGGAHTCALNTAGQAFCWGFGPLGQLGNGTLAEDQRTPVPVSGGHTWSSISAGSNRTCGVTTAGGGYCWGNTRVPGGAIGQIVVPASLSSTITWQHISPADDHACGLTTGGEAYCWGLNDWGQLGNGTTARGHPLSFVLERVTGGHVWNSVDAGDVHTCGITTAGEAYCWGYNSFGELGDGSQPVGNSTTPTRVAGGFNWASISAGLRLTCGITRSADAYCWGYGQYGQLGNGTGTIRQTTPSLVSGGHKWLAISASDGFVCGITTLGHAYCWGVGQHGQLGTGSTDYFNVPVRVVR